MMDLLSLTGIRARLEKLFPEGMPNRHQLTWDIAVRTVFVMIYVDAVEGQDIWLRPDQVTRMTHEQAGLTEPEHRQAWAKASVRPGRQEIAGRWYAVNTRESIRDDTLRNGLVAIGAVVERAGLTTTSPAGRYALQAEFAGIFRSELSEAEVEEAISTWQERHLNAGARMRIAVMRKGSASGGDRILITFPGGETQRMAPGPSSDLSKAVIEVFSERFLKQPAVIFLSESRDKVIARHDSLARQIGLSILPDRNLPDIILADLGVEPPRLVFVEVVASDGPVSEHRRTSLLAVTDKAGFSRKQVAFVTAYADKGRAEFRRTIGSVAWGTFAWFASEPEYLLRFDDTPGTLWD